MRVQQVWQAGLMMDDGIPRPARLPVIKDVIMTSSSSERHAAPREGLQGPEARPCPFPALSRFPLRLPRKHHRGSPDGDLYAARAYGTQMCNRQRILCNSHVTRCTLCITPQSQPESYYYTFHTGWNMSSGWTHDFVCVDLVPQYLICNCYTSLF